MGADIIKASDLLILLKENGYKFYSGVPCSSFKMMLDTIFNDSDVRYIKAVRENAALGLASGAYLTGNLACVVMQNSGLGNILNALTSFSLLYKIPVLLLISWRGFNSKDAVEHIIIGKKTISILEALKIPYRILSANYKEDMNWAFKKIKKLSIPVAMLIKKDLVV